MKTLIKSPLKNAANNIVKIGSTPNARKIKSLDFDRPRENETFIKWIESSSKIFESVDLPNKRELKKLADFDVIGGGGGLAGLLAALGGLGLSLTGGLGLPGLPRLPFRRGPNNRRNKPNNKNKPGRPGGRPGSGTARPRTDSRGNQIARRGAQYRSQLGRIVRPGQTPAGVRMGPRPGSLGSRFASARANMQTGTLFGGRGASLQRGLYNAPGRIQRGVQATRQAITRVTQPVTTAASRVRGGISKAISPFKTALKGVSRIPIIGSLLAGVFTYFEDENGDGIPDRNLNKSLFVAGGTAIGGLLGSFIPIPVLGTLMGTLIGEYAGGLFYELIQGRGAAFVGKKFQDDMKKLLSAGKAVLDWAGRGFSRLYEGMPKINIFGLKAIDPRRMLEGVAKLPKAFFTDLPMNETKEEEEKRLKKEEEQRIKQQQEQEAQRDRSEAIQDEEQLPYTTTEDGEVVPTMASFREDPIENAVLQESVSAQQNPNAKVIEYITGDRSSSQYRADHGGGNYHEHVAFSSQDEKEKAKQFLRGKGITTGSEYRPGDPGYHGVDRALDIPLYPNIQNFGLPDNRAGEEKFSAIFRRAMAAGGFTGSGISGSATMASLDKVSPVTPSVQIPTTTSTRTSNSVVVIPQQQQNQQPGSQIVPIPMNGGSRSQGADQMSTGVSESDVLNSLWQTLLLTKLSE